MDDVAGSAAKDALFAKVFDSAELGPYIAGADVAELVDGMSRCVGLVRGGFLMDAAALKTAGATVRRYLVFRCRSSLYVCALYRARGCFRFILFIGGCMTCFNFDIYVYQFFFFFIPWGILLQSD